jgi:fluoroquinolone transport system permease protein
MNLLATLTTNDSRLILRDSFLRLMFGMILLLTLMLKFGLPLVSDLLAARGLLPGLLGPDDLSAFTPLALSYFMLFDGPLLVGFIFGFVVLDEKEDHTLDAMAVTPVAVETYLSWRVMLTWALGFALTLVPLLFIGLSLPPLPVLIVLCAVAGLGAPLTMLFLAATASDKVQGFAVAKFLGIGGLLILIGWFVPGWLSWVFGGLFPPFFSAKAYWLALEGDGLWMLAALLAAVGQAALILVFQRLIDHRLRA